MVKLVGFPPPIDAATLSPGTPFRFGDHDPAGYAIVVKVGERLMGIVFGKVKGQPEAPGFLPIADFKATCYAVEAELVVTRTKDTKELDAVSHGVLAFDGANKPFIVIEQPDPQPRLFVSLETGEAQITAPKGYIRMFGGWSLTLEANGTVLAKLQT